MKKNLTNFEKSEFEYLIKVLSSAVNSTQCPLPFENINWERMNKIVDLCSVRSLFANAVLKLPKSSLPSGEAYRKLCEIKNHELLIDGVMTYEVEKLLTAFDKHSIKNIPLKGYFMKKEYSQSDFRSLSDFDILFDVNYIDAVKTAFNELGYTFLHSDDNQYHFQKKPYMYIEMHTTLVHEWENYYEYLKNQLNKSTKRNGYAYSYKMSCEDYYLYMLVHNSNHFRIGGMGVRMVLDTYVYYRNHKNDFDFEYLNSRLKMYKLDKFEKCVRTIAFNWFSGESSIITFNDIETYILLSTTLGRVNVSTMVASEKAQREMGKKSKLSYLISSAFPSKSNMQKTYLYLKKYPFLLPVSWVSRLFKSAVIEKKLHAKRVLENYLGYKDDDINYLKKVLKQVGFDDLN